MNTLDNSDNQGLVALTESEMENVNGGAFFVPFLGAIAVSFVSAAAYDGIKWGWKKWRN